MSEPEGQDIVEVAKSLNIGAVIPELYKDAISPAAKEVGKGLQTIARATNIALKPLAGLVWGYEKIEDYLVSALSNKFQNKNVEDIVSPQLHLAGPLVEAFKYTGYQELLREMYVNLLASAMDRTVMDNAHPSFVEVIRQLSPDEARILIHIKQSNKLPIVSRFQLSPWNSSHIMYEGLKKEFATVCQGANVELKHLSNTYLDNLIRLKILDFGHQLDSGTFGARGSPGLGQISEENLFVTSYGCQFIGACIS